MTEKVEALEEVVPIKKLRAWELARQCIAPSYAGLLIPEDFVLKIRFEHEMKIGEAIVNNFHKLKREQREWIKIDRVAQQNKEAHKCVEKDFSKTSVVKI